MKQLYFLAWLTFALAFTSATAQVVYVKKDATGANNGTSWQNAYTNLQSALDNPTAEEIWIAQGTYYPGGANPDSSARFAITKPVDLYGGFLGNETSLSQRNPLNNLSILSGDIANDDQNGVFNSGKIDNTQHVIFVDSLLTGSTILDGLYIEGAHASNFNMQPQYFWKGGGVHALSPVKIRNCRFYNNFARSGAAIYLSDGASGSEVEDCLFIDNMAGSQSAGIFAENVSILAIRRSQFISNQTQRGAFYPLNCTNVLVDSCAFVNNTNTGGFGGAMFVFDTWAMVVSNTLFDGNTAANAGAVYYDARDLSSDDPDDLIFENCEFKNNSSSDFGGGAFYGSQASFTFRQCEFNLNSSTGSAAHSFSNIPNKAAVFEDCTFFGGNAGGWGGAQSCYGTNGTYTIRRCTYENNTASELGGAVNNGFAATITYDSCTFLNNKSLSSSGGALSLQNDSTTVIVERSYFSENSASGNGGAIFSGAASSSSIVIVDKSEFWLNSAGAGGAIHIGENGDDDIAYLGASNSIFANNSADPQGGAINLVDADADIVSCLFFENNAAGIGTGGAISNNASDSNQVVVNIVNSTFAFNTGDLAAGIAQWTADSDLAVAEMNIQNNIFAQDGGLNYAIEGGNPSLISLGGNLSDDSSMEDYLTHPKDINEQSPTFVDPDDFDYHLANGSVGINAGVSAGAPALDLEGNPRVGPVDMGAYENQTPSSSRETLTANNGALRLFSNPVAGKNVVGELNNGWKGELEIRLVSLSGQVACTWNVSKAGEVLRLELPLAGVRAGIFEVVISNGEQVVVEKMVRL